MTDNTTPDYAAIVAINAPEAARELTRGLVRLRFMATAMLNLCIAGADSAAVKLDAERAAGICKGDKMVRPTVAGVQTILNADESQKVKAAFATTFSHVAFWTGELRATDVKPDAEAMRASLLDGTTALSSGYHKIRAVRAEATAKAVAEALAAAEAELLSNVPAADPAADAADDAASLTMEIMKLVERLAAFDVVNVTADVASAFAMLNEAMADFSDRSTANVEPEAVAA